MLRVHTGLRFVAAMQALRVERGWTEGQFASQVDRATGMSINGRQVIRWERGERGITSAQAVQIAQFFGKTVDEMVELGAPITADPRSRQPRSFVYFIGAEGTDFVKIGIAADVEVRRCVLQTASPFLLVTLAVMPGGRATELRLHEQFADVRTVGEWFRRTPELDQLIAANRL